MNLSAEELRAVVEARLEKAARAYGEAKGVAAMGYWETAANRLFSLRQAGDYDDAYAVSESDVSPNIEPAGRLIEHVAALARQRLSAPV